MRLNDYLVCNVGTPVMFDLLLNYTKYFYKYMGGGLVAVLTFSALAGALDGISIMLLIPLLGLYLLGGDRNESADGSVPTILENLLNYLSPGNLLLVVGALIIVRGLITYAGLYLNATCRARFLAELRKEISAHSLTELSDYSADGGKISNLLVEQTSRASFGFYHYSQLASHTFNGFTYISLSLFLSVGATLNFAVVGVVVYLFFRKINRQVAVLSKDLVVANGGLSQSFLNIFHGKEYLFVTRLMDRLSPIIDSKIRVTKNCAEKVGALSAVTQSVREPLALFCLGSIVYVQLTFFSAEPALLIVVIVMLYRSFSAIMGIQNYIQYALEYLAGLDEIRGLIEKADENEPPKHSGKQCASRVPADQLCLENVEVSVAGGSEKILKDINLEIWKGDSVAIVGRSGAGKSTLISVLLDLKRPNSGTSLARRSGENVGTTIWCLGTIGYVPQRVAIFDGSVEENVAMEWTGGSLEKNAEDLEFVLSEMQLTDSNLAEQNGYKSKTASVLSGGQRQRVAIARERFRGTDVLVVDEPSSALDPITASSLIDVLKRFIDDGGTLILATHSESLARICDRTIVLDGGTIVEDGLTSNLIHNGDSKFREIFQ